MYKYHGFGISSVLLSTIPNLTGETSYSSTTTGSNTTHSQLVLNKAQGTRIYWAPHQEGAVDITPLILPFAKLNSQSFTVVQGQTVLCV